jgi:phosphoribosylanthranilate isomerase
MKIKVCGMSNSLNIKELLELSPDFMGFIFYEKSPRFVGETLDAELLKSFPKNIKKVGVFVNATADFILTNVRKYSLDYVQFHGNETPDFCKSLYRKGINIIKAFRIDNSFIFSQLNNYKPHCDFFLFDAKGDNYGGNGVAFDWNILKKYDNEKPFFLAGGIDLDNILELENHNIYAIDVNSKFEISPAMKDIEKLEELMNIIKPLEVL